MLFSFWLPLVFLPDVLVRVYFSPDQLRPGEQHQTYLGLCQVDFGEFRLVTKISTFDQNFDVWRKKTKKKLVKSRNFDCKKLLQ